MSTTEPALRASEGDRNEDIDDLDAAHTQIKRLTRRLERERRAREEAEGIADRRMRELWLTNQELDKRVAEQTESIKAAYELLEQSFNAATRFVSNLSHEMLTPLNGVMGMLELIEQHSHSDTLTGYVSTAHDSAERLHLLVRRLLDLVQLSAGLLHVNPVSTTADELRTSIENRWRVRCLQSQKLLTVSFAGTSYQDPIRIDVERVLQIVDELVDNARLHADAGVVEVSVGVQGPSTEPAVTVAATDADGAADPVPHAHVVQITIADAGPGFVPSVSTGLADAILQVDTSPGRATEGAGIGLALATELCRALRGSLTIDSSPGSPTTATVKLPIEA